MFHHKCSVKPCDLVLIWFCMFGDVGGYFHIYFHFFFLMLHSFPSHFCVVNFLLLCHVFALVGGQRSQQG